MSLMKFFHRIRFLRYVCGCREIVAYSVLYRGERNFDAGKLSLFGLPSSHSPGLYRSLARLLH